MILPLKAWRNLELLKLKIRFNNGPMLFERRSA
ncbi:hypothetical protein EMEDMD4_90262 [Sinorhizobium medicae]|uniref:Uncharacterized protein n=1 Tax=Sinorhizobium medicae TaxID=110321 RepID=A0A508X7U9_9HYPH|nr:hypothetical protein EMEDMD4_90262 [Sinorhizobium medicae]